MKLLAIDPTCPNCIKESKVELIEGSPCKIKVYVKLAPPPTGHKFPSPGENVTLAKLVFKDDDDNDGTQVLGPPLGPDYALWDSGKSFTITFDAPSWLTKSDFAKTFAQLDITTDRPRIVKQKWYGI